MHFDAHIVGQYKINEKNALLCHYYHVLLSAIYARIERKYRRTNVMVMK